jgi:hypothetical protein
MMKIIKCLIEPNENIEQKLINPSTSEKENKVLQNNNFVA